MLSISDDKVFKGVTDGRCNNVECIMFQGWQFCPMDALLWMRALWTYIPRAYGLHYCVVCKQKVTANQLKSLTLGFTSTFKKTIYPNILELTGRLRLVPQTSTI